MTIRIGDKVRFLNSIGGGIVSGFKNKELVHVEDEDGFEVPILITECVIIEQSEGPALTNAPTASVSIEQDKAPLILLDKKNDFEAWLAIAPEYYDVPLQGKMDLYLINDSNYYFYYLCEENKLNGKVIADGLLYPNTHQPIGTYTAPELGDIAKMRVRIMPFMRSKEYPTLPNIEKVVTFNAVKLAKSKSYEETTLLSFPAMMMPLHKDALENAIKDLHEEGISGKHSKPESQLKSPKKTSEIVEVDLHIEALLDDITGMSKGDMLEHQLKIFNDTIKEYKNQKGKRIVFIHGVGNGRLKNDIRNSLTNKHKMDFQDASFREYGYGATLVIVR